MDEVKDDLGIEVNYTTASEHVPESERNNRTIKERYRSLYHYLPYANMPRIMIKAGLEEVTMKLNCVVPKEGVSKQYSPYTILHKRPLDYQKHCKYAHGTYVQAEDEFHPKNTMRARTMDAIY